MNTEKDMPSATHTVTVYLDAYDTDDELSLMMALSRVMFLFGGRLTPRSRTRCAEWLFLREAEKSGPEIKNT